MGVWEGRKEGREREEESKRGRIETERIWLGVSEEGGTEKREWRSIETECTKPNRFVYTVHVTGLVQVDKR